MCARYSAAKDLAEFARFFNFICRVAFFAPRFNIAPRQQAPVIVLNQFQPVLKLMRWGLIPAWATRLRSTSTWQEVESIGGKLINARAETIFEKPSFRKPMERQRCLIPADGFYEWQAEVRPPTEGRLPITARGDARPTGKTPFRFTMKDGGPFCFAGLWEKWIRPPEAQEFLIDDLGDVPQPSRVIETFTIITTTPNAMAAAIHDRMPVILSPDHYGWWLDELREGDDLKSLLRPYPAEDMKCYRVSRQVNNARNDSPECVRPA